jgi:hypothetical protein
VEVRSSAGCVLRIEETGYQHCMYTLVDPLTLPGRTLPGGPYTMREAKALAQALLQDAHLSDDGNLVLGPDPTVPLKLDAVSPSVPQLAAGQVIRAESEDYITNGHWMLLRSAVSEKTASTLTDPKHQDATRGPIRARALQQVWDGALKGAGQEAAPEEVLYESLNGPLARVGGSWFNATYLRTLLHITKADTIKVGGPKDPCALFRQDRPVAILMPLKAPKAAIVARRLPQPPKS